MKSNDISIEKKINNFVMSFLNKLYINRFIIKVIKVVKRITNIILYQIYCLNNKLSIKQKNIQRQMMFDYCPLISIVIPLYNTKPFFFHQLMKSIINQTYSNWEICVSDGSTIPQTRKLVEKYKNKLHKRLKVIYLGENLGISGNTNEAIKLTEGDFIGFMDHDDLLSENALYEVVKAINEHPEVDFLYSDEDKISSNGKYRFEAFFKPAYSPDTLRSINYICHFSVTSKQLLNRIGYCRSQFDGSQDYDLILRLTENANMIIHIPRVLYHWRVHSLSTSSNYNNKSYALNAGLYAISDHLSRNDISGFVESVNQHYRVSYSILNNPKVSIIIQSCNSGLSLKRCIDSILIKSTYSNYEIIIVENGTTDEETLSYYDEIQLNDKIKIKKYNNKLDHVEANIKGAEGCLSPYILFLSSQTTIISSDWLERMLEHIQRNSVGIVGAKLLNADNTIAHCGIIVGNKSNVIYPLVKRNEHDNIYYCVLNIIRNVSSVSDSCLMIKNDLFNSLIINSDKDFTHDFDVNICLKVLSEGFSVVWIPYALLYLFDNTLVDHNIIIRQYEDKMQFIWGDKIDKCDYYYNPNLLDSSNECYIVNVMNENFSNRTFIKQNCKGII